MNQRIFAHQITDQSYFELPRLCVKSGGGMDRVARSMPEGWELLTVKPVEHSLERRTFAGNYVHFSDQQPQAIAS